MRKLIVAIVFCISLFSLHCFGQNEITVREIFYQVDEDGTIHVRKTLGERVLVYIGGRGLTRIEYEGGFRRNEVNRNVDVYDISLSKSLKINMSESIFDERKRLVECTEQSSNSTCIKHFIRYNQYDDPVEIKSVINNGNGESTCLSTVTFEYIYFCDYPLLKLPDAQLNIYHNAGFISSKQGCPWMLRTIKKDGVTVQHAERKLRGKNS